jgi:hypothetical protein
MHGGVFAVNKTQRSALKVSSNAVAMDAMSSGEKEPFVKRGRIGIAADLKTNIPFTSMRWLKANNACARVNSEGCHFRSYVR